MNTQEDLNEQQAEVIFTLQAENTDLKENMHAKVDTIYQELQEIKTLILTLIPPSTLRLQAGVSGSVSSVGSCQSESGYTANDQQVTVHGKGLFPVYVKNANGKLFSRRHDGSFKVLSPVQRQFMHPVHGMSDI
jgi:hypothetical protein